MISWLNVKSCDASTWRDEVTAQEFEQYFVSLWDRLRQSKRRLELLGDVKFDRLSLPPAIASEPLGLGIRRQRFSKDPVLVPVDRWQAILHSLKKRGFEIEECEFHHATFRPGESNESEVDFVFHLARPVEANAKQRLIARGAINVTWKAKEKPRTRISYALGNPVADGARRIQKDV